MPNARWSVMPLLLALGCGSDRSGDDVANESGPESSGTEASSGESSETTASTEDETSVDDESSTDTTTDTTDATDTDTDTDTTGTDTDEGGCQTDPESCPDPTVCDFITGECLPVDSACLLSGPITDCQGTACGPGSACDDQGSCIPIAPCGSVVCEGSSCWGESCPCEREVPCTTATEAQLNGPFSSLIIALDFADDCNAWMVTLQDGTDYLRRLTPSGDVTQWGGVSNLDMGEVKVLKALFPQTPAAAIDDIHNPLDPGPRPTPLGMADNGEVALTYTCVSGCYFDSPQGVAHLIEGDPQPLPLVLAAVPTIGENGPFGYPVADGGPMGLTWGDDLVLYAGNIQENGDFHSVDLVLGTSALVTTFSSRVTGAAPISGVHLLVALDTGELLRFNTETSQSTPVVDLMSSVSSLSHDSYTGKVYASLQDGRVMEVDPFSGEATEFALMPNLGRVAVSPEGKLWYVPAKYLVGNLPLTHWPLPSTF